MGTGEGEERASVVPVILHSSFILHPSSHRGPAVERNDPAHQVDCGAGADWHGQRSQVRAPSSGSEPRPTQNRKCPQPCAQLEFQSALLTKPCFRRFLVGSSPYMTAIADSKHRVTLRQARPGDRFDVEILAEGKYVLTRLEPTKPQPRRVRFEKRSGYTVGISDQPVSEQAIRAALDEFP